MATGVQPAEVESAVRDMLIADQPGARDHMEILRSPGADAEGTWYRSYPASKLGGASSLARSSQSADRRLNSAASMARPPSSNRSDGGVYHLRDMTVLLAQDSDAQDYVDWPLSDDELSVGFGPEADAEDLVGSPLAVGRWEDLPDGILREITRHMAPSYVRVMRLVCRSWAEFAGRHTSTLKPERVAGPRLAQRFPHLRSLDLSHCQHMVVHPKQNELRLQSSLTDAALQHLEPLRFLRNLSLRGCNMVEGPGLRCIVALTALRSLDLTGCVRLTNKGLEHVAALSALTHLNLRECRLITNDGLRRLEPLVQLKHFSMSNCTSVSDRGLQSLAKLTGLEIINISRCNYVTDRGFSTLLLSPLPALRRIVVRKCPGVTEDGLREIAAHKAANDGCQLELPAALSSARARHPASGPFVDAWLNQGAFGPIGHGGILPAHGNGNNVAHFGGLAPLNLHH